MLTPSLNRPMPQLQMKSSPKPSFHSTAPKAAVTTKQPAFSGKTNLPTAAVIISALSFIGTVGGGICVSSMPYRGR